MYVNVGVRYTTDSSDIPTKKALKAALASEPDNVDFYTTSEFSAKYGFTGANLADHTKYAVTGPNPYTSRKWYATVEKLPNGKITVK